MHNDVAIILQGKISFNTEKIIEYYQNFNCKMILSTYKNTVNFNPNKYKNLDIVECDMLSELGIGNRNIQKWSAFHGIERARNYGIKYSLKSRTDHIFKNPNTINILKMNINSYPLFNATGQYNRIIIPNAGTTLNQQWGGPFHVSDHWLFGETEDIYNYFDIHNPYWDKNKSFNIIKNIASEVEYCRLWMMRQNINYKSFSDLLKDKFIVLDNEMLYYDQVKQENPEIMHIKTDWDTWCDPLTVHSRLWFNFLNGKTYTPEQEVVLSQHQKFDI